jgi:prolyl 4-hydroxylase
MYAHAGGHHDLRPQPEALLVLNVRAARGDPEALYTLAGMSWGGQSVPQDPAKGRDLYRRAAEAGNREAAYNYTNLLANGVAGPRDWPQALRRLETEARKDARRRRTFELVAKMTLSPNGDPPVPVRREVLSTAPEVTLFPRLFTAAECEYLRDLAEPGYGPSIVNDLNGATIRDPIRTSDGSTFHWLIEDPAVHALNRRLAAASGSAFDQGEAMQILRYRPGDQYRPHLDAREAANPRILTALAYLNHDYKGGETTFVETRLSVKGRKGDVLVFRNTGPDGRPDRLSKHAGMPVTAGTKYLASRWIRERRWIP